MTVTLALPSFDDATVVVPAPGAGPGNWSGAASAVLDDGVFWLTYRVRRPLAEGRGVAVVVARSTTASPSRPSPRSRARSSAPSPSSGPSSSVAPTAAGGSTSRAPPPAASTGGSRPSTPTPPPSSATGARTVVLPGSATEAVKDPVVLHDGDTWRMWICVHPLDEPGHEDRMTTAYATSADGLVWTWHGTVLRPTDGAWDARGARVTAVLTLDPLAVLYDGRVASRGQLARGDRGRPLRRRSRRSSPTRDPALVLPALRRRAALRRGRAAPGRRQPVVRRGGAARRRPRPGHRPRRPDRSSEPDRRVPDRPRRAGHDPSSPGLSTGCG